METGFERPEELHSTTYKIRMPTMKEAYYITISDLEKDGKFTPWEIFLSTKNSANTGLIVTITRLASALLQQPNIVVDNIIEELKSIVDADGGFWFGGEKVASFSAALGVMLELHVNKKGKYGTE